MTHSTVQSDQSPALLQDPDATDAPTVAVRHPTLSLVPTGDGVANPAPSIEQDPGPLERAADQALAAACDAITDTASDLLQHAADARLARVAADTQQAEAIADCAAQAAVAVKLGNEATAQRTAWVASRAAQTLAAQTLPGDEVTAEAAARHTAELVAQTAQAHAVELADAADRARSSVAAAAEDVIEVAATMELVTRLGALSQESAVGGIAFHTSVQVALNSAFTPHSG